MVASQRHFDLLQLEEKAGHAMDVASVFARRPGWDRGSRRLSGSLDSWNVKSWTGCVDVTTRSTCRRRGRPAWGAPARASLRHSFSRPTSWISWHWQQTRSWASQCSSL
eukprot:7388452-Prymnesium_polylepis.1